MYTIETVKREIEVRLQKPATREIDFSNGTMEQKISALKNLGGKIEDETTYKVTRKFEQGEKSAKDFANEVKAVASIEDILAIMNGEKNAIEVSAQIKGKNLSQKQQISVMAEQVGSKIDGTKVVVDELGGENFRELLKYVREMSDEDFKSLISK